MVTVILGSHIIRIWKNTFDNHVLSMHTKKHKRINLSHYLPEYHCSLYTYRTREQVSLVVTESESWHTSQFSLLTKVIPFIPPIGPVLLRTLTFQKDNQKWTLKTTSLVKQTRPKWTCSVWLFIWRTENRNRRRA